MSGDDNADNGGQQQQAPDTQQGQQGQQAQPDQQAQPAQQGQQDGQQGQQGGQQSRQGQQGDQGDNNGGNDGNNTGRSPGTEQTFSQADLDRIVGERLARERGKYADYDELKAKANEFDELKRSQMSEQEKAVDKARSEGEAAAATKFGARMVDAEIRVASAGRMSGDQLTALLEGLDRTRFLTNTNEVDTARVTTFVDAVAPAVPATPAVPVAGGAAMGQGRRPAISQPTLATGRERYQQKHQRTTT